MAPLIVIGSGHAGLTLVREFRKLDSQMPVTVICEDSGEAYYKPNLSKALTSGKTADELVMKTPDALRQELGVELLTHHRVVAIAPDQHQLTVDTGSESLTLSYSRLILATGASPMQLPFHALAKQAGVELLSVNNLQDYRHFRQRLINVRSVAIIGAGFVGCEFASDLSGQGIGVSVIDVADWPLQRNVPEPIGQAIMDASRREGVSWYMGDSVNAFERDAGKNILELESGARIEADLVLSAVGLAANTQLATEAGLQVDRGILVDSSLQTSAADIFALGDCARLMGRDSPDGGSVLPFIIPATASARTLAAVLAGQTAELKLPALAVPVKLSWLPTVIYPMGTAEGNWKVEGTAPDIKARFDSSQGKLIGYALTGEMVKLKNQLNGEVA